jgi:L-fucose isomerase-like protein
MSILLIPLGYPGYPLEDVKNRIEESKKFLESLSINYKASENIITVSDCSSAIELANTFHYDYTIALISTWIECPNALSILEFVKHKPVLLWSLANIGGKQDDEVISFGSIPAAAVLRETLEEMHYKFKFVVGNPYDVNLAKEIKQFDKAACTIEKLRKTRLGLAGYVSMGMYTGLGDHIKVKQLTGSEIVHIDQYSILRKLGKSDPQKVSPIKEQLKSKWSLGKNIEDAMLDKTADLYFSIKEIIEEQQLDSLTVKCQYEMSIEFGFTPCVALSILAEELPVSCEGDIYLLLSQMILNNVSGRVTTYGDVLGFLDNGIICAACGFAPKCFLAPDKPEICKHTALYSGLLITSAFKKEVVTIIRMANENAGFKMHLIKGHLEDPGNFHEIGCPQYAGMAIVFENKNVETFKQEMMSQHYAVVFGDYENEIREFCRLMNIRVV